MGKISLSNHPENWIYDTSGYKKWELAKIFAALPVKIEKLGEYRVLITPNKGQEKAMRIICGRVFSRVRGENAKEIFEHHKAATHS